MHSTIPVQAVLRNGNQESVLVVDANHHVVPRTIVTGLQGTNLVEVKSGLAEGDQVITGGQANYTAGETVVPNVQPTPEADSSEESGGTK